MIRIFSYLLLLVILFSSCRTTKYVPEDEYLLDKYTIKGQQGKVKKDELENYFRQKPNKKILGFHFYLGLYNLSNEDKDGWIHRTLRKIGEEPVIYDDLMAERTARQLKLYLQNKGYYHATVEDTVIRKNQKAKVVYRIKPEEAFRIRNIHYEFEDTTLSKIVLNDTVNSLLNRDDLFDVDVLSAERERIEMHLKNHGYYYFTKEFIFFHADTSVADHKVDIELIIKEYRVSTENGGYVEKSHPPVIIGDVYINTDFDSRRVLRNNEGKQNEMDTLFFNNINLLYLNELKIKPGVITGSTYIISGELYNLENVRRTYRNLSSLRLFRLVNIEFRDIDSVNHEGQIVLDCEMFLTPQTLQSYAVELQGTNSSGNIGAAGNLSYQNRNLFRGAENLSFNVKGAIETLKDSDREEYGNMIELGSEVRLNIPKFFLPFNTDQFIKKFNPSTSISAAYNYQRRPDYHRTIANASFGYNWKGNSNLTHIINPVELNLVSIPFKSREFSDWIQGKYIFYSYQSHLVTVTNYSLIFNNQNIQKRTDFTYFRMNLESAGNILSTAYDLANIEKTDGHYRLFNTRFAQYILGDFDFRYYYMINEYSSLVYRVFAGAGLPYNNSTALPFEKTYFAGGANGIRAWQARNLGPGSYEELERLTYPNKTADIKLEANMEYRFKLFWVLEGAFFIDAGNIWAINENDEREGALFKPGSFYKDIAIGTGFGTRFVFSFFTFRLDLGIKVRDPILPEGNKWILGTKKMTSDDFTINIGIGYPF